MEHKSYINKQRDYSLEIINYLTKEKGHVRALARTLKTNPMTISRKISDLVNGNILDFKQEGKNKVFFIKKTIEARAFAISSESYKLIKLIEKHSGLRSIIEKIQKDKRIKLAVLFGSYAKSMETIDSDIDIYIETEDRNIRKELSMLNSKLSIKIGKYKKENELIREIEKNHVIIKGIEEYYEKSKTFS